MITTNQRQLRLQIILGVVIGLTLPCYGLGLLFVSLDRSAEATQTTPTVELATQTQEPQLTDTPTPIIPTRYPTFTATLSPTATQTATLTMTASPTATETSTPEPSDTSTPTITATLTSTPSPTQAPSATVPPPTATGSGD